MAARIRANFGLRCVQVDVGFEGIACRCWCKVLRVSLSDWLAFQTRIRGSKDPRLLRDRPTDGATFFAKIHAGMGRIVCAGSVAVRAGL